MARAFPRVPAREDVGRTKCTKPVRDLTRDAGVPAGTRFRGQECPRHLGPRVPQAALLFLIPAYIEGRGAAEPARLCYQGPRLHCGVTSSLGSFVLVPPQGSQVAVQSNEQGQPVLLLPDCSRRGR